MKLLSGLIAAVLGVGLLISGFPGSPDSVNETPVSVANQDTATFAGGCFWCMEPPFDKLEGVQSTISGFSGGHVENPSYREVTTGNTGHAEVVQIIYDSTLVSYSELLNVFWRNIDPTQADGQFCDIGNQYRSAIFYHNAHQKRLANESKTVLQESGILSEPIVTEIHPFEAFFAAEDYHQNFYKTHSARYKQYRQACGRDRALQELWGDTETSGLF